MTFAKQTGCQGSKTQQYWTLNRFCNKLNTRVVGGASKLLHHFIKKYNPSSIVSYSHNDISNGNLYKKLGYKEIHRRIGYYDDDDALLLEKIL